MSNQNQLDKEKHDSGLGSSNIVPIFSHHNPQTSIINHYHLVSPSRDLLINPQPKTNYLAQFTLHITSTNHLHFSITLFSNPFTQLSPSFITPNYPFLPSQELTHWSGKWVFPPKINRMALSSFYYFTFNCLLFTSFNYIVAFCLFAEQLGLVPLPILVVYPLIPSLRLLYFHG